MGILQKAVCDSKWNDCSHWLYGSGGTSTDYCGMFDDVVEQSDLKIASTWKAGDKLKCIVDTSKDQDILDIRTGEIYPYVGYYDDDYWIVAIEGEEPIQINKEDFIKVIM